MMTELIICFVIAFVFSFIGVNSITKTKQSVDFAIRNWKQLPNPDDVYVNRYIFLRGAQQFMQTVRNKFNQFQHVLTNKEIWESASNEAAAAGLARDAVLPTLAKQTVSGFVKPNVISSLLNQTPDGLGFPEGVAAILRYGM